jgi:hypothetical protein
MTPKELKREILNRLSSDVTTIEVICEMIESSDENDYHDVADMIKADTTMLAVVTNEFQKRNMLPKDATEINLVDLFKDM